MDLARARDVVRLAARNQVGIPLGGWVGNDSAVDAYIRRVVLDIDDAPSLLVCTADLDQFAHAELFVTWRDRSAWRTEADEFRVDGFSVLISRLGPVAAITRLNWIAGDSQCCASPRPELASVVDSAPSGWEPAYDEIDQVLARHEIVRLPRVVLSEPVDDDIDLRTNHLAPYVVFDAWFRWPP